MKLNEFESTIEQLTKKVEELSSELSTLRSEKSNEVQDFTPIIKTEVDALRSEVFDAFKNMQAPPAFKEEEPPNQPKIKTIEELIGI